MVIVAEKLKVVGQLEAEVGATAALKEVTAKEVGVGVGVAVGVGVDVEAGVGVGVAIMLGRGVDVLRGVAIGLTVGVGVSVGVSVGVGVGDSEGVGFVDREPKNQTPAPNPSNKTNTPIPIIIFVKGDFFEVSAVFDPPFGSMLTDNMMSTANCQLFFSGCFFLKS